MGSPSGWVTGSGSGSVRPPSRRMRQGRARNWRFPREDAWPPPSPLGLVYASDAGADATRRPSRPLSRILSRTVIPLGRRSPSASSGVPGDGAGHTIAPLHRLATGSACPFHPALRRFVTVALASPRGGGGLPLSLPCVVRTFLDGLRRRDRLACSVGFILSRFARVFSTWSRPVSPRPPPPPLGL